MGREEVAAELVGTVELVETDGPVGTVGLVGTAASSGTSVDRLMISTLLEGSRIDV